MAASESMLYRRVGELLHYVWDPIGIANIPATCDEYQQYLPEVLTMLEKGANASSIASYLESVAIEQMGLNSNPERSKRVAKLLLDLQTEVAAADRRQT